jgi:hypothetical protein
MVEIGNKLITNLPQDNLLVVDAMNLAFRWKHQGASRFVSEFVSTVKSLARSYKCGQIVIAADQGGSTYRREIFPDYKANRKELYANDTEEEKEATRKFFDEYERVIEACDRELQLTSLLEELRLDIEISGLSVQTEIGTFWLDQMSVVSLPLPEKNRLLIRGITLCLQSSTSHSNVLLEIKGTISQEFPMSVLNALQASLNSMETYLILQTLCLSLENINISSQSITLEPSSYALTSNSWTSSPTAKKQLVKTISSILSRESQASQSSKEKHVQ